MANSGRCKVCHKTDSDGDHFRVGVTYQIADKSFHKFEPDPISGEASDFNEIRTGVYEAASVPNKVDDARVAEIINRGGASTGEQPPQCSAQSPHPAHTFGGRPMQYCSGIEPEWKKCPQCGRENSVETWRKLGGKCPNCNDLHDKEAARPVSGTEPARPPSFCGMCGELAEPCEHFANLGQTAVSGTEGVPTLMEIEAEEMLTQYDEEHHDYLDGRPHQWQAWRHKLLKKLSFLSQGRNPVSGTEETPDSRMRCSECQEPMCDHVAKKLLPWLSGTEESAEPRSKRVATQVLEWLDTNKADPRYYPRSNRAIIETVAALIEVGMAAAPSLTPRCPRCGGKVYVQIDTTIGTGTGYCKNRNCNFVGTFRQFFSAQEAGQ
jgi:hypothetical protein